MLSWKFEGGLLVAMNVETGCWLAVGSCEGLNGQLLAEILNAVPVLSQYLVPPNFLKSGATPNISAMGSYPQTA